MEDSSLQQGKLIADYILKNPAHFDTLMEYFLNGHYRLAQRAARPVNLCVEQQPKLILPYLDRVIENIKNPIHPAIRRNGLRMLQFIRIPEKYDGQLADICFKCINDVREPTAIRVFAMSVVLQIVHRYPELKVELKTLLEEHLPYSTAGFKSRGKKVLKALAQIG